MSGSTQGHHLYTLLLTKFQGHRSTGSDEENFNGFTIYRHGDHLSQVTQFSCMNFHSSSLISLYMKIGFK